jgi:hypothetical protein
MPEPRTKLPKGAPQGLVDFARCKVNDVEIASGEITWLPKPKGKLVPDVKPSATFAPGANGAVDVSVGWGFIGVTVTASVVDGSLVVTTENPLLPKEELDKFTKNLNDDLKDNGKAFDKVEIVKGKLKLSKRAIGAGRQAAATGVGGAIRRHPVATAGATLGALALGIATYVGLTDSGQPSAAGTTTSTTTTTLPGQVGGLPSCDTAPTDAQLAAATAGPLSGFETGEWPAVPIALDPRYHVQCTGYQGDWMGQFASTASTHLFPDGGLFMVGPGQTYVSHARSVTDAQTGEMGLSLYGWGLPANFSLMGFNVDLTYNCDGKDSNSTGTGSDGAIVGEGPLFQFGTCSPSYIGMMVGESRRMFAGEPMAGFSVGPTEGSFDDASLRPAWSTDDVYVPATLADLLFPATVVRDSLLGATAATADCVWGVSPNTTNGALGATDCYGWGYWSFDQIRGSSRAGLPEVIGSGMGTIRARIIGGHYQNYGRLLFANTLYHCGPGRLAFTVCATDGAVIPEGPWTIAQVVLVEPLSLQPEAEITIGFGFDLDGDPSTGDASGGGDAGGVEVEYRVTGTPGGEWTVARHDGAPTTARVLLAENSATLVVAASEIGDTAGYRTYVTSGGETNAFPEFGDPWISSAEYELPMADIGGPAIDGTTTTVGAAESVEEFVALFVAAIAEGDADFLVARLHPIVLQMQDEELCRSFVEGEILSLGDYALAGEVTGPTTVTIEGVEVTNYYSAQVTFVFEGETVETIGAFALVDGQMRWLAVCR